MRIAGVFLLISAAVAGCLDASGEDGTDACAAATEHVGDCYGAEYASAFAEVCDDEAAQSALDEGCGNDSLGKADGFGTYIHPDREEHFKYGSIGADFQGVPEAIFRALPLVCEDLWRDLGAQPADADPTDEPYAAFGLIYEDGKRTPIGFSTRRLPLFGRNLVGPNCAFCHTALVRESADAEPELFLGAPNARFDIESYNRFLLGCIESSDFTKANIKSAFRQLGIYDPLLAGFAGIFLEPFTRDARAKFHSLVTDGPWGPGRDDAIGLSAAFLLGEEFVPPIPGPVDYPSVWNQDEREGGLLHWDGAAGSAFERNVLVAVGAGTPEHKVPFDSIAAIQDWIEELDPPSYPYPIDWSVVLQGQTLFRDHCASCHVRTGERFGEVVPLAEIGTDANRVSTITEEAVVALNNLRGRGWEFGGFRKSNGYVNALLDGVWLRAPYLHNGSVPTLRDLLKPASERPTTFYRGYNVYNQEDVGYESTVPPRAHAPAYGLFDTSRAGNGNGGHEYGTELPESDKDALIEYLKVL